MHVLPGEAGVTAGVSFGTVQVPGPEGRYSLVISPFETTAAQPSVSGRFASRISNRQWRARHYWSRLVSALAMSALVGVGSYAATYRALVLVFEPAVTTAPIPLAAHLPGPAPSASLAPTPTGQ